VNDTALWQKSVCCGEGKDTEHPVLFLSLFFAWKAVFKIEFCREMFTFVHYKSPASWTVNAWHIFECVAYQALYAMLKGSIHLSLIGWGLMPTVFISYKRGSSQQIIGAGEDHHLLNRESFRWNSGNQSQFQRELCGSKVIDAPVLHIEIDDGGIPCTINRRVKVHMLATLHFVTGRTVEEPRRNLRHFSGRCLRGAGPTKVSYRKK
jgi:hypothetical protein